MTTTQITRPSTTDRVRYFNLNGREITAPRTLARYAAMHADSWEMDARMRGAVSTFACAECGGVMPTGHCHDADCATLIALWP